MNSESRTRLAARLIGKGLQPRAVPANDKEYRALVALYEAESDFRELVLDVAVGLELAVLSVSPRGIILAPANAESRFAFRLGDLRQNLSAEDKAILALIHTAIAAQFYPTGESLDDELYNAPPVTERQTLTALKAACQQFAARGSAASQGLAAELQTGWMSVLDKPEALPEQQRRRTSTLEGLVTLAFRHMLEAGLVRRDVDDGVNSRYTANWRLTVQLRESTFALFQSTRNALQASAAVLAAGATGASAALPSTAEVDRA